MTDILDRVYANDFATPEDAIYQGQILDGAKKIAKYLNYIGFSDITERRVFHWAADGRLPVTKIGNRLVANKRSLLRHFGVNESQ